ncbi:MAG TPA: SpoIIE family protein phosphatase [Acidimicrobiia bacterium]|jgi:serine phosphatase RsbU (regulator of sigma subunit)
MLLRRRLLLLFVAIVAAVLAVGVLMVVTLRDRDDAQQRERKLSVTVERVAQLMAAHGDQETGERGYVLSNGVETFLNPYEIGRATAGKLTAQLRAALDRPGLRRDLDRVTEAVADWRRDAAAPEIALMRAGNAEGAATRIADGPGKELFDGVRRAQATLAQRVQTEDLRAQRHLDDIRSQLTNLFVAIAAVAIAGAVVAGWLIRRWVTRPIDQLAAEVRRARSGALDSPIQISGPPELASLALDVDAMRGYIRQQLVESERSRQAVEQSAAVVLTLRSELEPVVGDIPDGWTMAGRLRAAEGVVAGDCYDLFATRSGEIALIVVDIAGHGATEGILALRCKEMLRTALTSGASPGEALETTAEILGDMGDEVFLTAFVAAIDTADGTVRFANAGHPPAYIVGDDSVVALEPTGPLVGLLVPGWKTAEATIAPGDNLCAYTDGLIETRNGDNEFFGPERLVELLQGARCSEAQAVVKRGIDEVELFSPDGLRDDATIVVLCRAE